ncbi:MAG: hypothetical protein HY717_19265 [Planctomycetes bacterium]|nr:hypothetical protein [Planctomycetota bacterium]
MRNRFRSPLAIPALALLLNVAATGELPLEGLLSQLKSPDPFESQRAEVEIHQRGSSALVSLAPLLVTPDGALDLRLEGVFKDLLDAFLDELETDFLTLANDQLEIKRLDEILKAKSAPEQEAEIAERLNNLGERVKERAPHVEERMALLSKLMPAALGEMLKRMETLPLVLVTAYQGFFDRTWQGLGAAGVLIDPAGPGFGSRRYLLSPLWFWLAAQKGTHAKEAEALLDRHLGATLQDLASPDYRARGRAEDEFFLLGRHGLEFLKSQKPAPPASYQRLISLLEWRIHPRVRERTSMDFSGYASLPFRERRQLVIRYARVAGRDAIPTLRLVVLDDARESSLRVKLAAAEALAGLRDLTGIQFLTNRPLPELLKIPEISRRLFLIKGEEYQSEKKYGLAIQEFQKILDESPFDFEANYRIAFAYLLDKQFKKSIHHFEIARRIQPQDMLTLYNLACAYSLDKQKEKALEALEESVEAGFNDAKHIQNDTDLNPIRGEPKFKKILEKIEGK